MQKKSSLQVEVFLSLSRSAFSWDKSSSPLWWESQQNQTFSKSYIPALFQHGFPDYLHYRSCLEFMPNECCITPEKALNDA